MIIPISHLALLTLSAFIAGYVDSIAGGGGMINMPALLLAGLPPHQVLGTNKLAGIFGTMNATRIYIRKKIFNPKPWLLGFAVMFIGGILGSYTTHFISPDHLKKLLPWFIIAIVIYMSWPKKKPNLNLNTESAKPPSPWLIVSVSLCLGWYDGFFGPGTGAFLTVIGISLFSMSLPASVGMARFLNMGGNLAATASFMIMGNVNYTIGLCMAVASVLGGQLGAHSAVRFGEKFIRPLFILVVLSMALRLLWLEYL